MRSFSTYLTNEDVRLIVHTSGLQIRDFFHFLMTGDQRSPFFRLNKAVGHLLSVDTETNDILRSIKAKKIKLSDQALVNYGDDIANAHRHSVRIEVRKNPMVSGAPQIAVRGIPGDFRSITLKKFWSLAPFKSKRLVIKRGGFRSYEINVANVNKSLPIYYLNANWSKILQWMDYQPGTLIDARKTYTVVAADGDGTLFGKPKVDGVPQLSDSPVQEPLINYLETGGIFILISGNSLERTIQRVIKNIPLGLKNRFLISANGGADLVGFDRNGKAKMMHDYHREALKSKTRKAKKILDIIYLGDDADPHGNDADAFKEVGKKRSILVGPAHAKTKNRFMKSHMFTDAERSTAKFLKAVCREIRRAKAPFFSAKRLGKICQDCR